MVKNRSLHIGRRRLSLRRWVPYAVLLVSCLLTVTIGLYVAITIDARARAPFLNSAEGTRQQIEGRVNTYLEVTRAAAALFASSNETNPAEFRAFVANLALPERYPGLEGIGFSQRIPRRDLGAVVRAISLDSGTNLRVAPRGNRPEYYPIVFLEPTDGQHRHPIGFDIWTDPVQRAAMERARDSGQPTLSAKVDATEPVEEGPSEGFILYVPIYRTGASIQTVDERRRALVGFVFSPFHSVAFFKNIVGDTPSVAFEVYDGVMPQPAALLHRSTRDTDVLQYQSTQLVHVAGREWLTIVTSLGGAVVGFPSAARWTLIAGMLLSVMLFVMTRVQVGAWESAAHHQTVLEASERALRESESQLRDLVVREREARTQAQEADRSKDEFLATLSHELRTPLNAVLGWLSMLRTGSLPEERRRHALEVIDRNARLQAHLIEDLLDVSRIVTGKMRLDLQPLTIASTASAVVDSLRPTADAGGVHLHAAIAPGSGAIHGDLARIQQIIWNLLSNAIKFTPRGGHVSVELNEEGSFVQLSVSDTGVGIAPEFLPHVFERFRQADSSTTRAHTGVGLGLAITRCLVELHGGSVEAHSEGLNQGARFVVRLPANAASTAASPAGFEVPRSGRLAGVHILVVDDDADTRELLSEALGASGAHVTTADSARRAFEELVRKPADALISDIGMPGEDGLSLIRQVRAMPGMHGRIPAIALTALAHDADRERAADAGFQMHLAKPVELATLEAELLKLLAKSPPPSSTA
ncbi:MAG TPA: CHASE domain-containing protein [Vicinamibacterales bacterium]